jgi:REP element-mobilizing transposase RayT
MKFDSKIHHRHSIRLKGYDYSQSGAYFVTLVTWQRECLFGEIVDGEMVLHRYGQIVRDAWFDLRNHYRHLDLGAFVVMPNHAHGIIALINDGEPLRNGRGGSLMLGETILSDESRAGVEPLPTSQTRPYVTAKPCHGLPEIVRAFKSFSARRINRLRRTEGIPVWQRNYYEHIIRNESEMDRISRYIESNPSRWADDDENPMKTKP